MSTDSDVSAEITSGSPTKTAGEGDDASMELNSSEKSPTEVRKIQFTPQTVGVPAALVKTIALQF